MDAPDPGLCLVWKAGWMLLSLADFWHEGWQLVLINNAESSRGSCDVKGSMEKQRLLVALHRRSMALRQVLHWRQFYGCMGHMELTGWPTPFCGISHPSAMAGQLGNRKWRRGCSDKLLLPLALILVMWALFTWCSCSRAFFFTASPMWGSNASENHCLQPGRRENTRAIQSLAWHS